MFLTNTTKVRVKVLLANPIISQNLTASNTCILLFFKMRCGSVCPPPSTCKVVIKGCFPVVREMVSLQG